MAKPRMTFNVLLRKSHEWLGVGGTITLGLIALSCPFIAHGGGGGFGEALKKIHYGEFLAPEWKWLWIDLQGLVLMLLVLTGWIMHRKAVKRAAENAANKVRAEMLAAQKASAPAAITNPPPAMAKTMSDTAKWDL
jgi:hypothetical protein